jgi:hypothetical protein
MAKLIMLLDLDALELDTVHVCTKCGEPLDDKQEPLEAFLSMHAQPEYVHMLTQLTDRVGQTMSFNGKLDPRTLRLVQKEFGNMIADYLKRCQAAYEEDNQIATNQEQQQESPARKHQGNDLQRIPTKAGGGRVIQ